MPDPENPCQSCGAAISAEASGNQCPVCLSGLMSLALSRDELTKPIIGTESTFAEYTLHEELARGGMGVVYRATDRSLGREVALKMIVSGSIADTAVVERFEREARAVAMLDHPNIVPIYETSEFEGQHFFAMRMITDPLPLQGLGLTQNDELPPKKVQRKIAECLLKITDAIAYAHARGVIHCDLKPSNILLDSAHEPHLTDFGLARVLDGGALDLTRSSVIAGTPGYMAPEQADGLGDVTLATDIYGLGAVLYELLTGSPPHTGSSAFEVLRDIVEKPVPAILPTHPKVDRDLATIAEKCLRKDPANRYQSANALADDLRAYLAEQPIAARPITRIEAFVRLIKRHPAISLLSLLLITSIIAGLTFFILENRKVARTNLSLTQTVSQLQWQQMVERAEGGRPDLALATLAESLRKDPADWRAATYAISLLENRHWAGPVAELSHDGAEITAHSVAPEMDRLLTAGADGCLILWNTKNGKSISKITLPNPAEKIRSIQLSSDGKKALLLSGLAQLQRWDLSTNPPRLFAERRDLEPEKITSIHLSKNGEHIYFLAKDGLRVLPTNLADKPRFLPLANARNFVESEDGSRFAVFSNHELFLTQKVSEQSLKKRFKTPLKELKFIEGDGSSFVTLLGKGEIKRWDSQSGQAIATMDLSPIIATTDSLTNILSMAVLPDRRTLAVAVGFRAIIGFTDLVTGRTELQTIRHGPGIVHFENIPGQNLSLTVGEDTRARVWDLKNGSQLCSPIQLTSRFLKVSSAGKNTLLIPEKHVLKLWRIHPPRLPRRFDGENEAIDSTVTISPDDQLAAYSFEPRGVQVAEIASGRVLFEKPDLVAWNTLFDPAQKWIVNAGPGSLVRFFALPDGRPLLKEPFDLGFPILPTSISPDGSLLGFGGPDGEVSVRTIPDLHEVFFGRHDHLLSNVIFSDGNAQLLTTDGGGSVRLWDLKTGEELLRLEVGAKVSFAGFLDQDGRIVTADFTGTATLWNAKTGARLGQPMKHRSEIVNATLSPDGALLVTGNRDGEARVWDTQTGQALTPPIEHGSPVVEIGFRPDGQSFYTVCLTGLRLFESQTGRPISTSMQGGLSQSYGYNSQGRKPMTSDGSGVLLGINAERINYWSLPVPPKDQPAPNWLADFLEAVAMVKADGQGGFQSLDLHKALEIFKKAGDLEGENWYSERVLNYLRR